MKSCENCKCGYWQMCDNGYGRYPEVLCYLHKNCWGDEPYRIYEEEWVESAESCQHYADEQTQVETNRIAEEYKEELMNQWKEVQKKKTVMAQKEDIEIKPKIIYQEDYQKTRLYKLADEYVDEYFDEYFDYRHLRTIETLYGLERANETVRNHIRDVYRDGYEDALRDAFLVLKQFKEFNYMSFETFKKDLLNG